ncbi:hypothetical protein BV898_13017 [Hypsibius exemplaris]|uniref:WAP domain-containing protein n=1 Tax=Hypsibius exemplaris TaxID=2072580 RepID=A0A1W0WBV2_HYPEX|nr:hypothetical protein BV898_13017 [Hypsibius exemplaris]
MNAHVVVACLVAAAVAVPFAVTGTSISALPPVLPPSPKFGNCPYSPTWNAAVCLFDKHAPQCKDDSSCPGVQKCCATQSCYLKCENPTCLPPPVQKAWTCPKPSGAGICLEACSGDGQCPGNQKCCKTGCGGHVCQAPYRPNSGFCPLSKAATVGPCLDACSSDATCASNQKCCQTKCGGHSCQDVVP